MKLIKIYLRYFPPGIALSYIKHSVEQTKFIDLYELTPKCDISLIVRQLAKKEPYLITKDVIPQLKDLLEKLQAKLKEPSKNKFYLYKTLQTHVLPLTNVDFDRNSQRCITGSYDRTCRIWDIETGNELNILKGHENVVFSVAFNYPKCDRIITGSFDKTARIWNAVSGAFLTTLYGHTGEIVGAEFSKKCSDLASTCSMDGTARVFHVETGQEVNLFKQHEAEVISCHFNNDGNLLITGSFDENAIIWDIRQKDSVHVLRGHEAELSNCIWNFPCNRIATSSLDKTVKIWDLRNIRYPEFCATHNDEILDVCFDYTGKFATASSDTTAKVWDITSSLKLVSLMEGHTDEVSKVTFSPNGRFLLTASADKTARLWYLNEEDSTNGLCMQVLSGHENEVFSCAFNYSGDAIITASKDNTCKIYR